MVQSSSITTSLIVSLAGAGVLTLNKIFPFTLGENVILVGTAKGAATDFEGNYIIKDIDKNLIKFFGFIKNDAAIISLILVAIHHDKLN